MCQSSRPEELSDAKSNFLIPFLWIAGCFKNIFAFKIIKIESVLGISFVLVK